MFSVFFNKTPNFFLKQAQRHLVSIMWVKIGGKKLEKNQKNKQTKKSKNKLLRVRLYWGSGCEPWNNRAKEKFERKQNRKMFFFLKKSLPYFVLTGKLCPKHT